MSYSLEVMGEGEDLGWGYSEKVEGFVGEGAV